MCGIVGYTGPREAGPILIEGLAAPRVPRLRLGGDRAGRRRRRPVRREAGRQAGQPRRPRSPTGRRTPRSASPTRAGPPTAGRTTSTPIPTRTARARSRSSTTGSSRTSASCATGSTARGHTLTSETDTEALAHLVEEAYAGDLADAVRAALRQAEGAYAIAVMHRGEGDRLVGARKDVPLVVGPRRRRELPRAATWRRSSPTPTRSSSSRRATSPTSARGASPSPTSTACRASASVDDHRLVARGRREGRLRALHAQGDPRAARVAAPVASPAG